jgi:large subunit ribosomal protein L7Ae
VLVVVAHDVDPTELVIFTHALCREIGVPYASVIVNGKVHLGTVVHNETAAVLAIKGVHSGP